MLLGGREEGENGFVESVCVMKGEKGNLAYGFSSVHTQILRRAVGSEYPKTFLMPSRAVGETLPPEVLEDYEAHEQLKAQQAELMARTEAEAEAKAMGKAAPGQKNSEGLTVSVLTVDTAGSPARTP